MIKCTQKQIRELKAAFSWALARFEAGDRQADRARSKGSRARMNQAPPELQKEKHHLFAEYDRREALFVIFAILPIFCFVFSGFVIIGRQFWGWLKLGHWSTIALHDVLNWWIGRPFPTYRVETALLSVFGWPDAFRGMERELVTLDRVARWLLDTVPLALWLIVVFPAIWFLTWSQFFRLFAPRTPASAF
jgi:hypothetical protein